MSHLSSVNGAAVAFFVIGLSLDAAVVRQLRTGKTYISNPPTKVARAEDPFSYWLSVGFIGVLAAFFTVTGAAGVIASLIVH